MPINELLEVKLLVGGLAIPEYTKDEKTYVECNLNTPNSYTQSLQDSVAGEIEKQEWPVTPYRILIRNLSREKTYYIRVFIDGIKVKALSLCEQELKIIKGFKDGPVLKEFLFSMPRFAKDETDRLQENRVSDVGCIRVESWNAQRKTSKWCMRDQQLNFVQANKKDSTKVTNGEYTMATSKVGKAIADRSVLRRVDSWKRVSLENSVMIQYHMCHTLQSMGFDLKPFPVAPVAEAGPSTLLTDVKIKKEDGTATDPIKIDDDEGVVIDLTEERDRGGVRATKSGSKEKNKNSSPIHTADKHGSNRVKKIVVKGLKRRQDDSENVDATSAKKKGSNRSLDSLVCKLSDMIDQAPEASSSMDVLPGRKGASSSTDVLPGRKEDSLIVDDEEMSVISPEESVGKASSDVAEEPSDQKDDDEESATQCLSPEQQSPSTVDSSSPLHIGSPTQTEAKDDTSPPAIAESPKRIDTSLETDGTPPKKVKHSVENIISENKETPPSENREELVDDCDMASPETTNSDKEMDELLKDTTDDEAISEISDANNLDHREERSTDGVDPSILESGDDNDSLSRDMVDPGEIGNKETSMCIPDELNPSKENETGTIEKEKETSNSPDMMEIPNLDLEDKNCDPENKTPDSEVIDPDLEVQKPDPEVQKPDPEVHDADPEIKNPDLEIQKLNPDPELISAEKGQASPDENVLDLGSSQHETDDSGILTGDSGNLN